MSTLKESLQTGIWPEFAKLCKGEQYRFLEYLIKPTKMPAEIEPPANLPDRSEIEQHLRDLAKQLETGKIVGNIQPRMEELTPSQTPYKPQTEGNLALAPDPVVAPEKQPETQKEGKIIDATDRFKALGEKNKPQTKPESIFKKKPWLWRAGSTVAGVALGLFVKGQMDRNDQGVAEVPNTIPPTPESTETLEPTTTLGITKTVKPTNAITVTPDATNTRIATAYPTIEETPTPESLVFPESVEGTPILEIKTENGILGVSNNNPEHFSGLEGTGRGILNTPEAIAYLAEQLAKFASFEKFAQWWNQTNPQKMNGNVFFELNPEPSANEIQFSGFSEIDMILQTGLVPTTDVTDSRKPYKYYGTRIDEEGNLILQRHGNGYPERDYESLAEKGLTREQATSLMLVGDILNEMAMAMAVAKNGGRPLVNNTEVFATDPAVGEFMHYENARNLLDFLVPSIPSIGN